MADPIDNDSTDQQQGDKSDPAAVDQSQSSTSSSTDEGKPDSGADDQLGDGGKKALEAERNARREAERKLKARDGELEKLRTAALSDQERAVEEARQAGRAEATAAANAKLVEAEAIAKGARRLKDAELAPALLGDLGRYVDEDGNIDGERIAADLDELVADKPYLKLESSAPATGDDKSDGKPPAGSVPGGAKGEQSTTFKRSQLRDPAFYEANKDAILAAAREGRIVDDG